MCDGRVPRSRPVTRTGHCICDFYCSLLLPGVQVCVWWCVQGPGAGSRRGVPSLRTRFVRRFPRSGAPAAPAARGRRWWWVPRNAAGRRPDAPLGLGRPATIGRLALVGGTRRRRLLFCLFVCDLRHVSHGPRACTRLAVGRQTPRGYIISKSKSTGFTQTIPPGGGCRLDGIT